MTLRYVTTENFFNDEQCDFLVAEASKREFKPAGMTIGGRYVINKRIRNNSTIRIAEGDPLHPAVSAIHEKVHETNLSVFEFDIEAPLYGEIIRYDGALGEDFAWHPDDDFYHRRTPFRKLTAVVQLSRPDDYEGGVLELRDETQVAAVPRQRGLLTIFPSFTSHRVTPVTSGIRHTLVTFGIGPYWR